MARAGRVVLRSEVALNLELASRSVGSGTRRTVRPNNSLPIGLFVPPRWLDALQALDAELTNGWYQMLRAAQSRGTTLDLEDAEATLRAVVQQRLETDPSLHAMFEWEEDGEPRSHELTPERYGRLRGPYPRRNAYRAAVAYGPVLATRPASRALYQSVARYALCGERRLLRELGLVAEGQKVEKLRLRLEPRPGSDLGGLPTTLEAPCP